MALSASKFNLTVQKFVRKSVNLNSDTVKLALYTAATAPAATDSTYATTLAGGAAELAGSGGYTQAGVSLGAGITANSSGTETLKGTSNFASPTWTASGGGMSLRYFVLYDSTSTDLLGFWDYTSTLVLNGGNGDLLDLSASAFNTSYGTVV